MEFRWVKAGDPWLEGRRPFLHLLSEACQVAGAELEMEAQFGHVGRIHRPALPRLPLFGNALGVNPDAAAALAADKDYTARLLAGQGLPTPPGLLVFSPSYHSNMALKNTRVAAGLPGEAAALEWAQSQGYPIVLKPNGGSEGRGISRPNTPERLQEEIRHLFQSDTKVRLEVPCPGADYRLVVWEGNVRLAYRRDPVQITGDGRQTLQALTEALCEDLANTLRGPKIDRKAVEQHLSQQGYTQSHVLASGASLPLLPQANLSMGGTCTDITNAISPDAQALAVHAAEALGLTLAGVDILAPDLSQGSDQATVLEVNSAPGFDGFAAASSDNWTRARALLVDILTTYHTGH